MDKAFSAIAGTALGAYLIAVVAQGHALDLTIEAKKDWRYLEFLAAVYALYLLHKSSFGGQVVDMLITTAIIAVVIKIAGEGGMAGNVSTAFSSFSRGTDSNGKQFGLTELFESLLGFAGKSNG